MLIVSHDRSSSLALRYCSAFGECRVGLAVGWEQGVWWQRRDDGCVNHWLIRGDDEDVEPRGTQGGTSLTFAGPVNSGFGIGSRGVADRVICHGVSALPCPGDAPPRIRIGAMHGMSKKEPRSSPNDGLALLVSGLLVFPRGIARAW